MDDKDLKHVKALQQRADQIIEMLELNVWPNLDDEMTQECGVLMMVAAAGENGISEDAAQAFWDELQMAWETFQVFKAIALGFTYPDIENDQLVLKPGVKA